MPSSPSDRRPYCSSSQASAVSPQYVVHKRHSFASRALALGESLPMIGKLLGHHDVSEEPKPGFSFNDYETIR